MQSGSTFLNEKGLFILSGEQVKIHRHLDALFRHWATLTHATEYVFPPLLPVQTLNKIDYFTSFPHLTSLTTQIELTEEKTKQFMDFAKRQAFSKIDKNFIAPAYHALPSAACYAIYAYFQEEKLEGDLFITVCSPCFRHEAKYIAGERQLFFWMREIVCIGQLESVRRFLDFYQKLLTNKLTEACMPFHFRQATDPFFDKHDPKIFMQRMEPLKYELLYKDTLAIASVNFHRNFFGERFNIRDTNGEIAFSGCVAFGLERWLFACLNEYGPNWKDWPPTLKE